MEKDNKEGFLFRLIGVLYLMFGMAFMLACLYYFVDMVVFIIELICEFWFIIPIVIGILLLFIGIGSTIEHFQGVREEKRIQKIIKTKLNESNTSTANCPRS